MKNTKLHRYNLSHEYCVDEIKEILKLNSQFYSTISIRCVAIKEEKEPSVWRNALCVIKAFPKEIVAKKFNSRIYDNICLLEDWLGPGDLIDFITEFKNGIIKIADIDVNIENPDLRQVQYLHESYWPEPFPGYLYSAYGGGQRINVPNDPLLNHKNPFYPNPDSAIASWCEISDYQGPSDSRMGIVSIFLPECRAYFEKLVYMPGEKKLSIKIAHREKDLDIFLKGAYKSPYGYQELSYEVKSYTISIPINENVAENLEQFEIYLLDGNNNILDFHKESQFSIKERIRIFRIPIKTEKKDDIIDKAIQIGESNTLEFKPFIKIGDNKINEIIETIIAFANTNGGKIIIGINKYVVPVGIENDLGKEAKRHNKSYKDFLEEYIGYIRKEISDKLNKLPDYRIEKRAFSDHDFLVIDISAGSQKPYANIQTKDIFIRKGSNNVKPDPDTELPKLIPGKEDLLRW
ncbi:ATP-binding protein [candidate division WOR-3 bacterium]|nr:ATP-binding protein [candidate division WOR-3 bacterium]